MKYLQPHNGIDYIRELIQQARQLACSYEVILLTSNTFKTRNSDDYVEYSIKSEFLSDDEEIKIVTALHNNGFSVRQFYNEEDFIEYVSSSNHQELSNKIVISTAQKGTKIGRKSLIPAICDLYGISHVGSNPYVVSLCRDKYRCGCILATNGMPVPDAWLYQPANGWLPNPPSTMNQQVIIKPNYEASSIGIDAFNVCNNSTIYKKVHQLESIYHQEIIVEKFIAGYEIEVPVIVANNTPMVFIPAGIKLDGNKKMGNRILDYNLRNNDAYAYYDFSCEDPKTSKNVLDFSIKAAKILNIKGFGRIDFRVTEDGSPYITDIATNPHYTTGSSYEFLFKSLGFSYDELLACLVATSIEEIR